MKKSLLLSAAAAATLAFSATDADVAALQKQIDALKSQVSDIKSNTNGDNVKFSIDNRVSYDMINYEDVNGNEYDNNGLLMNRFWLNMAAAPMDGLSFIGTLAYQKAFGATTPADRGFSSFDWVVNENSTDNTLKVKVAYFIYMGDMGNVHYTASFGRRPSTGGLPVHLRNNESAQSPLSHMVDVEFDGASFNFNFEDIVNIPGFAAKLCLGRGMTYAKTRFSMDGLDYEETQNAIDMAGVIFTPYDNKQYRLITQFVKGMNLIGYTNADMMAYQAGTVSSIGFNTFGDITGMTMTFMADGIGDDFEGFLADSKFFLSVSQSSTDPETGKSMLGSADKETGTSVYTGIQIPCLLVDGARIGLEYNQGSKYWRNFTYGEDTMAASKLAARGSAYEFYYTLPLLGEVLTAQLRHTQINYDYTGSQRFFGDDGTPHEIDSAMAKMQNAVESVSDTRLYIRYKY